MSAGEAEWLHGAPALAQQVEQALRSDWAGARVLAESARRRVIQLDDELVVKHFLEQGRRRVAGRLKREIGQAPALREFRSLQRLRAQGSSVPAPLGVARIADAEWLLVMGWIQGRTLAEALGDPDRDAGALLESVGATVRELHAAKTAHRDLHIGNVMVTARGPVLLDFASARRALPSDRIQDLGSFDFSLAHHGLPDALRGRFRLAALGAAGEHEPGVQRQLRRVEAATRAAGRAYYDSRSRRSLEPGRRYARAEHGDFRGMRLASFSQHALTAAVEAHRLAVARGGPELLKCDHRSRVSGIRCEGQSLVVKEVTKGGTAKRFADGFRGSPARRAWLAGHALRVRGIDVAKPLAFLERGGAGGPSASLLVLEDLRPAEPVVAFLRAELAEEREAAVDALCSLVIRLHASEVAHGDLQAHHVYLRRDADGLRAALIDLEGVRFPRRLSDAQRIRALAELNASLPDELASGEERGRAFRHYVSALPFRGSASRALEQIVSQSLARGHFWTGRDCDLRSGKPISPTGGPPEKPPQAKRAVRRSRT